MPYRPRAMRTLARCRILSTALAVSASLAICAIAQQEAQPPAHQPADAVSEEIRYADGLMKLGLSDYAKIVLDRIKEGEDGGRKQVLEINNLIMLGKFEEAKQIIAKQPDQESQDVLAMKLALADGYYAWGKFAEARAVYEMFLSKFPSAPPESLNEFFLSSAYKYAQMLILMGQKEAAVSAYDAALRAKMERHVRRQILSEKAELLVALAEKAEPSKRKAYYDQIQKICEEILWVQDIWFGKAIVYMAHTNLIEGNVDKAMDMVEDYWPQLKAIDDALREARKEGEDLLKISPMAECRFLLGVMMQNEAERLMADGKGDREKIVALLAGKKMPGKPGDTRERRSAGALQHLYTVFVSYPFTSWAPEAGIRARKIQELLASMGVDIKIKVDPNQMKEVEKAQFSEAKALFNQQQYAEAAESYVRVLNLFPEGEAAISALSDLATCYVEQKEELYADAVVGHIAERFCRHPELMAKAGDQILRLAIYFKEEKQMPDKSDRAYSLFFDNFQGHPRMAAMLYSFGEREFSARNYPKALEYFQQAQTYTNSPLSVDALSRIAACHNALSNTVEEIKVLDEYIKRLGTLDSPGFAVVSARYRQAYAYLRMGEKYTGSAVNRFNELVKMLSDEKNPYQKTPEEKEAASAILAGSLFYRGQCYAQLSRAGTDAEKYRQLAIDSFETVANKFPASEFAPNALSQIATLYTIMEKTEEAQRALDTLQKNHPDSAEAKNAKFLMAMNLLKLGRRQQAVEMFKQMFSSEGGKFSETQIMTAGVKLSEAGEYEIALDAFSRILASTKDRTLREPALLNRGKAFLELNRPADGIKDLEALVKEYPNSGYLIEAGFLLSKAYTGAALDEPDAGKREEAYTKAIAILNKVKKYEKSVAGRMKLDLGVADLWEKQASAEIKFGSPEKARQHKNEAIATYQSVVLLADPANPEARPLLEDAYAGSIRLMVEQEAWEDALEDCDKYLEQFPRGKWVNEIRSARSKCKLHVKTAGGGKIEEAAPAAPAPQNAAPTSTNAPAPQATKQDSTAAAGQAPQPATSPEPTSDNEQK